MRSLLVAVCLSAAALAFATAPASAQVNVVFGTTWDGPGAELQTILDTRYGAGHINVTNDYLGKTAAQPDPFIWSGLSFNSLLVREIAGNANNNNLGWYKETGSMPVIDGVDDGVVFNGPQGQGAVTMVTLGPGNTSFGFYMNPNGTGSATNAPEPEKFFTNRFFNDLGPDGSGALHSPANGDVQALIFDVSQWTQPNTWAVCFEDLDSGANPGPCCATTDNDFNDLVFEVSVARAVPVQVVTMSAMKSLFK